MKCQNCGEELPDFPEDAIDSGNLDEVVSHKEMDDLEYAATKKYFCDPECFIEKMAEGLVDISDLNNRPVEALRRVIVGYGMDRKEAMAAVSSLETELERNDAEKHEYLQEIGDRFDE